MPSKQGPIFEWDQKKSDKNLAERGFDFPYASRIFDGDVLEWEDTRRDYSEQRVTRDRRNRRESLRRCLHTAWRGAADYLSATSV